MAAWVKAVLLIAGLAGLIWLVASLALWALGSPLTLLISGIVSGALGLLLVARATAAR